MFITTDQAITLHYQYFPPSDGQPVLVFINSLGTDFRIWNAMIPVLRKRAGILMYDKRGHGLSDLGEPPYELNDHIMDIVALMDFLEIDNAVIIGLSVGGMIALQLAHLRPDLVQALVLCDTAHKIGNANLWNERIKQVEQGGLESIVDSILKRWFSENYRNPNNAEFRGYRTMLVRQSAAGYTGTCAAIRDADLECSTVKLRIPALCVVGDEDGATPPELVRSLSELLSAATFQIIRSSGHLPCIEQPNVLTKLITEFLDTTVKGDAKYV